MTFAHTLLSHHPWTYDGFSSSFINPQVSYSPHHFIPATCDDGKDFKNFLCTDEIMQLSKRMYGVNIKAADQMIGEVVSILEESGKFDSTMIIVTADHGFAFATNKDGRRIAPNDTYWQDLVKVPLLVKYPSQKQPLTVTEMRSTTQILHSVLDEFEIEAPANIAPSLAENSIIQTVDGNPQNLDFPNPSRWISDGGSFGQVENHMYPYALGSAALLMGYPSKSLVKSISAIKNASIVVDRHRDEPSPVDKQYRHLVTGSIKRNTCNNGSLVLVSDHVLVGTAHTFPSFQKPTLDGFWGVAQSGSPISDVHLYCLNK